MNKFSGNFFLKKTNVHIYLRKQIRQERLGYNSVVCYPSFTNSSIEFCPQSRIEKLSDSIDSLSPFEENRDTFATSILADSFQLNFDSDGRVVLPKKLLDHSGIKETVVFVGQGKTFQMWEPQKFSKFRNEARKKAKTLRSDLKWS